MPPVRRQDGVRGAGRRALRVAEIIKRLPADSDMVGAEVGVAHGLLSKALLEHFPKLTLYMVDSWSAGDGGTAQQARAWARILRAAKASVEFAGDRAKIIQADSVIGAASIEDASLDFAFIDDDHSAAGCKRTTEAYFPKIKHGGLIAWHDYGFLRGDCAVKEVVDAFAAERGLAIELGADNTVFVTVP